MFLDHISYLDMYFFCEMTRGSLRMHKTWLGTYLNQNLGTYWFQELDHDISSYRKYFDTLLRERAETSDAINSREQLIGQVSTWRSMMTSIARQAPQTRSKVLMQAAGHGLGSPRSVKDVKDFLVEVKARIKLHGDSFIKLGANHDVLNLPSQMLKGLEQASDVVASEKAEDNLSRTLLNELHSTLIDRFEKLSHAANAAALQGALLNDKVMENSGQDLLQHLTTALGEARVQSRARSARGDIPTDLALNSSDSNTDVDVDINTITGGTTNTGTNIQQPV